MRVVIKLWTKCYGDIEKLVIDRAWEMKYTALGLSLIEPEWFHLAAETMREGLYHTGEELKHMVGNCRMYFYCWLTRWSLKGFTGGERECYWRVKGNDNGKIVKFRLLNVLNVITLFHQHLPVTILLKELSLISQHDLVIFKFIS